MTSLELFMDDKGFSYPTEQDDQQSFFDQYLNDDSAQYLVDCTRPEPYEELNFNSEFDGDTTTSESHSASSNPISGQSSEPHYEQSQWVDRTAALRPARTFARSEQVNRSISGTELLTLEGKEHTRAACPISSAKQGTKSLRRRPKICSTSELERHKTHRILKAGSNDRMQSSFHYKQDAPLYHDWTQRFGQMDLQQTDSRRPNLSPPIAEDVENGPVHNSVQASHTQSPPAIASHRKRASEQALPRQRPQRHQSMIENPHQSSAEFLSFPQPSPIPSTQSTDGAFRMQSPIQPQTPSRLLNHQNSWTQQSTSFARQEYTVTPSDLHTYTDRWSESTAAENETSYIANVTQSPGDSSTPDFQTDFPYPFSPYHSQKHDAAPNGLPIYSPTYPSQIPLTPHNRDDMYPFPTPTSTYSPIPTVLQSRQPQTTTHLPLSTTPPPTPLDPPRSTRRRPKISTLQLHKSAPHLKSPSRSSLRSPRSAGALRSKTSGTLKSPGVPSPSRTTRHGGSKSASARHSRTLGTASTAVSRKSTTSTATLANPTESSFGFVNFTPQDSGRILTGVAPSGSSKTKARREQEQEEKKRKLSKVAEKAIRDVGGDPTELQQVFDL